MWCWKIYRRWKEESEFKRHTAECQSDLNHGNALRNVYCDAKEPTYVTS